VDERTVTRVVRDNATVQELVSERQSLPLNEQERDHWMRNPAEEPEAEALFQNSREAMVINDFEETPEGVIETQTLITKHVVPEAAPVIHEQEDVKERESVEAEALEHGDTSVQERQETPPHYEHSYEEHQQISPEHHEDSSPEQLPEPQQYDESLVESTTGLLFLLG
jgi:hypothetical protein